MVYIINTYKNFVDCDYKLLLCFVNDFMFLFHIVQEEFLLSGPTNTMGMIVTSDGLSQHQPLNWVDGLTAIGYSFPYILVLGKNTVTVHR